MKGMDEMWDMMWMKWKGQPRSRTYERRMNVGVWMENG